MKLLGATECDKVKNCLSTNVSLARIDEGKVQDPARIGKDKGSRQGNWFTINDRIIYDWQAYAGRYNPKTEQAHLVSIRDFERFLAGRSFEKVTPKVAGAYRDHLVKLRVLSKETGGLSNSTVRHRASHLAAFFKWLRGQSGYRRLSASIPDYFALPRSASAQPLSAEQRAFPSIEEAWRMVDLMPHETIAQRRDRAMVAFAFVCGLRAGALTSLRLKHLDLENKVVVQDAGDMRAKNDKSYHAAWFPRTDDFRNVFLEWARELKLLGFQAQDAVFPEIKDLGPRLPSAPAVEILASGRALQTAFSRASEPFGNRYTPHSARHTLKALGARICRTHEERKAWSMNLGHADEQITERHYGKMSAMRSQTIIEALNSDEVFTKEEQEMIIDFYENRFVRGTDEYRIARKLAERRERARGGDGITE
ncbi:MAG: site-specific integrase [Erythrobacter sp.]|uniref:tyrosine-type recombinase/integrase n=1 Tax=Erythrobacter sp. TaxID=1042 RepID=UPI003299F368